MPLFLFLRIQADRLLTCFLVHSRVRDCIAEGIPVKGYLYWSLMDNFEWHKGFSKTFGLIAIDRATQTRKPKESLSVLGRMAPGK
jgi:beta-glucosidase/6-phospho-beta-glucosidase/beta-galactosidase